MVLLLVWDEWNRLPSDEMVAVLLASTLGVERTQH